MTKTLSFHQGVPSSIPNFSFLPRQHSQPKVTGSCHHVADLHWAHSYQCWPGPALAATHIHVWPRKYIFSLSLISLFIKIKFKRNKITLNTLKGQRQNMLTAAGEDSTQKRVKILQANCKLCNHNNRRQKAQMAQVIQQPSHQPEGTHPADWHPRTGLAWSHFQLQMSCSPIHRLSFHGFSYVQ